MSMLEKLTTISAEKLVVCKYLIYMPYLQNGIKSKLNQKTGINFLNSLCSYYNLSKIIGIFEGKYV